MVCLLPTHRKTNDSIQALDLEVLPQKGVLCIDAVVVGEGGGREGRVVGGRGGFAVAEGRDDDDEVGGEGAAGIGGEGCGGVDEAAKAGGYESFLVRVGGA